MNEPVTITFPEVDVNGTDIWNLYVSDSDLTKFSGIGPFTKLEERANDSTEPDSDAG